MKATGSPGHARSLSPVKMRVRLCRTEALRHITFQEQGRLIQHAVEDAGLPVSQSGRKDGGFRIAQGLSLGPGYTSRCEYADMEIDPCHPLAFMPAAQFGAHLAACLPEGLTLCWARRMPPRTPHIRASVLSIYYTIGVDLDPLAADAFREALSWPLRRVKKGQEKTIELKRCIETLTVSHGCVRLAVRARDEGMPKPEEVLRSVFGLEENRIAPLPKERSGMSMLAPPHPRARSLELI